MAKIELRRRRRTQRIGPGTYNRESQARREKYATLVKGVGNVLSKAFGAYAKRRKEKEEEGPRKLGPEPLGAGAMGSGFERYMKKMPSKARASKTREQHFSDYTHKDDTLSTLNTDNKGLELTEAEFAEARRWMMSKGLGNDKKYFTESLKNTLENTPPVTVSPKGRVEVRSDYANFLNQKYGEGKLQERLGQPTYDALIRNATSESSMKAIEDRVRRGAMGYKTAKSEIDRLKKQGVIKPTDAEAAKTAARNASQQLIITNGKAIETIQDRRAERATGMQYFGVRGQDAVEMNNVSKAWRGGMSRLHDGSLSVNALRGEMEERIGNMKSASARHRTENALGKSMDSIYQSVFGLEKDEKGTWATQMGVKAKVVESEWATAAGEEIYRLGAIHYGKKWATATPEQRYGLLQKDYRRLRGVNERDNFASYMNRYSDAYEKAGIDPVEFANALMDRSGKADRANRLNEYQALIGRTSSAAGGDTSETVTPQNQTLGKSLDPVGTYIGARTEAQGTLLDAALRGLQGLWDRIK